MSNRAGETAEPDVHSLQSRPTKHPIRDLGTVTWQCLKLVREASPGGFLRVGALQALTGVGVAAELFLAKHLIDAVTHADDVATGLERVMPMLVLLVLIGAASSIASTVQREYQRVVAELVRRHVDDRLLDAAGCADLADFENPQFFDRLRRAELGGQSRPWQLTFGALMLVNGAITVIAISIALVAIEPLLLPLTIVASVPVWIATLRNSREAHAFAFRMTAEDREREYLGGILTARNLAKEVRLFALAPMLREKRDRLYDERITQLRRLVRRRLRRSIGAVLAAAVVTALAVVVVARLIMTDRLDIGGAAAAALAVQQLGIRLGSMYASIGSIHEGALFLKDFQAFTSLATKAGTAVRTPMPVASTAFAVTLENVSFAYPDTDEWALRDISLDIAPGQIVAVVGENGSGKTTLAKLLCHLYRPTSGRILRDGVDTATWDPARLRESVTAIFQDFGQYQLSARDNIAFGDPTRFADDAGVQRASIHAGADRHLSQLPNGYATRLGRVFDGGCELSIGQWQRVALARAFFRDAALLVLDEPTAALDARAEQELFENVRELVEGRTLVLISHRFSSVRAADRIVVLDRGLLVEEGDHDSLMARGGLYAELFTLQAASYAKIDNPQRARRGERERSGRNKDGARVQT